MCRKRSRSKLHVSIIPISVILALAVLLAPGPLTAGTASPVTFQYDFTGSADGLSFQVEGSFVGTSPSASKYSVFRPFYFNDFDRQFFAVPTGWGSGTAVGTGALTDHLFTTSRLSFYPADKDPALFEFTSLTSRADPQSDKFLGGTLSNIVVSDFGFAGIETFEQLFIPGSSTTNIGGDTYILNFITGAADESNEPSVEAPDPEMAQEPVLVMNDGAIKSTMTTGVDSMSNTLGNTQNAATNAVGDLNSRLFRARSRGGNNGGGVNVAARDHTTRFLNFAARNNIDHRVALGLADSREVPASANVTADGDSEKKASSFISVEVEAGAYAKNPAKNPYDGKVVIGDDPETRFEVFTSFDYGYYDQDNISATSRAFNTDSYSGTAGFEHRLNSWLYAGVAFTYLNSDTDLTANLGSNDLEGEVYSTYFTAFQGNTYFDFLYSYGDFDNDIRRNTLLGSFAEGDTTSSSHNFSMNTGHTIRKSKRFSFGPSAGLDYTTGQVNGYTERGGGLANLIYPDHDFESLISRLGAYATFENETRFGLNTTQFRAGWGHEYSPQDGNVTASLQTSPFALVTGGNAQQVGGFTVNQRGEHAGTDWLEVGATTRLDLQDCGAYLELGYQGMLLRENATGHYGSVKLGYEW